MDYQSSNNMADNATNMLHVAAALNLPSIAREIVNRNPELALNFDEHGLTPIHLAVANGHKLVIKVLLDSQIGDDICYLRDKGGFLPIHAAVMKGRIDVLELVNDNCRMWMLRESTLLGDNILHLALKFDSFEAFHYLWHFLSEDEMLLNSGDAEGNTLLHLAMAKRQQEIVRMLVGKVNLNAINLNGLSALDIFFDLGHEISEPQITRQPDRQIGTSVLFYLREKFFNFRRMLSKQVPTDKDGDMSNTLMIVATLIAAITFQSALNPPGGFIQDGKDRGMAVKEYYLSIYLFFTVMSFNSSLSVILLTIYIVPKWKDLIKLAMFITWISVFFTFMSFQHAIAVIFGKIIEHPLIVASLCIGDGIVLVFAFLMFLYSGFQLHKTMSTFLQARSANGRISRSNIIALSCISFLGAALIWLPVLLLDMRWYYIWFP